MRRRDLLAAIPFIPFVKLRAEEPKKIEEPKKEIKLKKEPKLKKGEKREHRVGTKYKMVPIKQITCRYPTRLLDEQSLLRLEDSIRKYGVINALVVRQPNPNKEQYGIVDGTHRFRAAAAVGLTEVPVLVVSNDNYLLSQIIESRPRIKSDPVEYRKQLLRFLKTHPTMTIAELATKIGRSPGWVYQQVELATEENNGRTKERRNHRVGRKLDTL